MLANNPDRAAQYFYETFLGCNIPINAARQTKAFYDLTKKFISSMDIPEADKVDLNTGLYTYLKVDKAATLDRTTFASQYLKPDMHDAFTQYMEGNNFPVTAIPKDLSNLQLKRRSLVFSSDVRLSAPAERFSELVKIEPIDGDPGPDGAKPKWTRITVRDQIRTEQ
jgi:nucleoid-associated protein YejK